MRQFAVFVLLFSSVQFPFCMPILPRLFFLFSNSYIVISCRCCNSTYMFFFPFFSFNLLKDCAMVLRFLRRFGWSMQGRGNSFWGLPPTLTRSYHMNSYATCFYFDYSSSVWKIERNPFLICKTARLHQAKAVKKSLSLSRTLFKYQLYIINL